MGVRSGRLEQWVEMLVRTQAWKSLPRSGFVQPWIIVTKARARVLIDTTFSMERRAYVV
jgi:hypothetical protein